MTARCCHLLAGTVLLCGWLAFVLAGDKLARLTAASWGSELASLAQGQSEDLARFAQNRMREGLWLLSLMVLWAGVHAGLDGWFRRGLPRDKRWLGHAVAGFVGLNVWVALAANTAGFWLLLGVGRLVPGVATGEEPYRQFQFKRCVAGEVAAPFRIVLVGSSQTHSQIDAAMLNERLGTNGCWATDLHFPGCQATELPLIEPQLARARPHLIVVYLAESALYFSKSARHASRFLTLGQLADRWTREALPYLSPREIGYGVLGDVLPLFRCRDAVGYRLLGRELMGLQANPRNPAPVDMRRNAEVRSAAYRVSRESVFKQQAFEEFLARCGRAGSRVLVLPGTESPLLADSVDPEVHLDFARFLAGLADRHPQVVLVPAAALPEQMQADYEPEDLLHANREMRLRFTLKVVEILRELLHEQGGRQGVNTGAWDSAGERTRGHQIASPELGCFSTANP